jgi:hypothetical protein
MKHNTTSALVMTCLAIFTTSFSGCSSKASESPKKAADATETAQAGETTTELSPIAADTATQTAPEMPAEVTPVVPKPAPVAPSGSLGTRSVSEDKLTTVLETVSREMEEKNLAYVIELGQDCSGIYHQIKDSVQARIPALRDPAKYIYPPFRPDRDSRQVAHWYHRHNNLHIVQDALADANKIRPGSVMFYGETDKTYNNPTIEQLTSRGVGIMHVAVVTSIETDDAGNLTAYTIMHGRNTKWTASRTGGNCDCPKKGLHKQHVKFPFGNWNQAWVAVANIETPAN